MKRITMMIAIITTVFTTMSCGQNSKYSSDANGVAVGGYDVVDYFNKYEATRGSKNFAISREGATFYFASAENKASFEANPESYLPQYGGYCAFAMAAKNAKVPSNPGTFKISHGKLYLFFNDYYEGTPFNTIVPWNADEANMKGKADSNWKAIK